jgi:hypothetical protein
MSLALIEIVSYIIIDMSRRFRSFRLRSKIYRVKAKMMMFLSYSKELRIKIRLLFFCKKNFKSKKELILLI